MFMLYDAENLDANSHYPIFFRYVCFRMACVTRVKMFDASKDEEYNRTRVVLHIVGCDSQAFFDH